MAGLVVTDFCYYWAHRGDHRIRLLWAAHSVHHSSTYFNMSTNLRLPWFHPVSYTVRSLAWLPAASLGFPVWMIFLLNTAGLIFQIPCHTERIKKLWRPYEFVFNSPSHHRVHHGSNPCYIDKNYGGVFILWDRMFGSYAEEVEYVRYGLMHDITTDNPLKYNYFETLAMLRELGAPQHCVTASDTSSGHPDGTGYRRDGALSSGCECWLAGGGYGLAGIIAERGGQSADAVIRRGGIHVLWCPDQARY